MSTPTFDLNQVLDIQKDYLTKVTSESQDPNSTSVIQNIQTNLTNMRNNYNNANLTTDNLITQQDKVMDIVSTEKQRLEQKKKSVDAVIYGQNRAVDLTDSARLRQSAYTRLLLIFIFTLGAFVLIIILSRSFPFIPQTVFDILSIIVISIGIYTGIYTFLDIQSRSNMNFNELNLPAIKNKDLGNTKLDNDNEVSLLDVININGCIGSDCCGPFTRWDEGNAICRAVTLNGFTTMNLAYNEGDLSKMKINADGPYEFSNYSPIK